MSTELTLFKRAPALRKAPLRVQRSAIAFIEGIECCRAQPVAVQNYSQTSPLGEESVWDVHVVHEQIVYDEDDTPVLHGFTEMQRTISRGNG